MWNITKHTTEKTLDDWAKLSVDVAKVAILAIPVILYGKDPIIIKIINAVLLGRVYGGLFAGRKFRKMKKGDTIMGLTFGLAVFAVVMIGWAYFANQCLNIKKFLKSLFTTQAFCYHSANGAEHTLTHSGNQPQ